jgi:hypothetical protein
MNTSRLEISKVNPSATNRMKLVSQILHFCIHSENQTTWARSLKWQCLAILMSLAAYCCYPKNVGWSLGTF